jgi:DNA-directed RNA polymerase specialized sigma24 family protein
VPPALLPEHLDALLERLGPDRDEAGQRYVSLSKRLYTVFCIRRCPSPEDLVNETLDRTGRKLLELGDQYEGEDPTPYVFGVAWNVARESFRRKAPEPLPEGRDIPDPEPGDTDDEQEVRAACLDQCLEDVLSEGERNLALEYYKGEKRSRIEHRAELARERGVSANALRLQIHRVTRRLRDCVFQCVDAGDPAGTIPAGPRLVKG